MADLTMTRADLIALAARVEQAQGPDRELDAEIVRLLTPNVVGIERGPLSPYDKTTPGAHWLFIYEPPRRWSDSWLPVPAYTASLDAALTLVPEGWGWHVDHLPPQTPWASLVRGGVMRHDCHGDTPALALCAAALRARAEDLPHG